MTDRPMPDDDATVALLREALKPAYLLVRHLGEGGMGAVYLAREPTLKRDVAVKVMQPWLAKDATARARFEREAQAVAAITHPHVINIYGTGELPDGTPYFVMQFIAGRSLESRIADDGPAGMREARRILGQVAAALCAAHQRGIIHRDIKAANVLQDAESGRVVVTDFGIAAVREAEAVGGKLTEPDTGSPGTPHYMAPEQLAGEPSTEKSDVYAFGLLAYELLTGSGPFQATSPHEIAAAHLRDVPKPLSALRGDMDGTIERLVAACLSKDPAQRPTAAQVAQQIAPDDDVLLEWPPPGLDTLARRFPKVTRRVGLGSGLLAAAILDMVLTDPGGGATVPLWMLEAAALTGALLLANAIGNAHRMRRAMRSAARQGYAWLPIFEVVADPRGDTGAVITGAREYAALTPAQRSLVRRWRLLRAGCAFGAAVAPLPALLLALRLAGKGLLEPWSVALLLPLPSLSLLAGAVLLGRIENRLVRGTRPARAKGAPAPELSRKAVTAWHDSFNAARAGQPLGDRPVGSRLTRLTLGAVLLLASVALIAVLPLALVNPIGAAFNAAAQPRMIRTMVRVRGAEAARGWAVAPDRSIHADTAGRAFHTIVSAGVTNNRGMLPPDVALPGFADRENPFLGDLPGLQDSVLLLGARRALSPSWQRQLATLEAHPAWPAFVTVARAPRVDIVGGRFAIAALDTMSWLAMDIPNYAPAKAAAYARVGVAALRLNQGRPVEAEQMLREVVGYGLAIMDNSSTLIETLVGSAVVVTGLDRLATFYDATGRAAEGRSLRAARDSAAVRAEREADAADLRAYSRSGPGAVARTMQTMIVNDSTLPPGIRWEYVRYVGVMPCFNARELVFGPAPDIVESMQAFQRSVVVSRADSAYLRANLAGFARGNDPGILGAAGRTVMSMFAGLLGNPRLERCAMLAAPGY